MRLKRLGLLFFLLVYVALSPVFALNKVATTEWPSTIYAGELETIQFIDLELKLPRSMVGRVVVSNLDWPNLAISRNEESAERVIVFRMMHEFNETYELFRKKGFFEGLDIHDAESFFDNLARDSDKPASVALKAMRHVMQIDDSVYTKTTKGVFTAYRLNSRDPAGQVIYVLIDGREAIYEIAGSISDADFTALLSGMTISSVH